MFLQRNGIVDSFLLVSLLAGTAAAQSSKGAADGPYGLLTWVVVIGMIGIVCVLLYMRRSKNAAAARGADAGRYIDYYGNESYDMEGVDAEKELEWLRKAKRSSSNPAREKSKTAAARPTPPVQRSMNETTAGKPMSIDDFNFDTKAFQEKMKKLQYGHLPINSFTELKQSKMYEPLPVSDDPSVLNAIEQANEEYEEDEAIREVSVRVLTAFRTRNSVEALSQLALYDLSSNLRAKAVATLTDFDHESVFESMLLACADPTREVRAAAARGLFRLNFDRADAWKRIIETGDQFRMRHAARAAIESGIVVKSLDRLVHEDLKVAYEAVVLVSLVLLSGELDVIFEAIKNHKDERVKFALLHVIKITKDERSIAALKEFRENGSFAPDFADRIRDTINSFEHVLV